MSKEVVKKGLVIGLAVAISGLCAFFASPAMANEPNKPAADTKKASSHKQTKSADKDKLAKLTEKLNLTKDQQEKIKPILDKEAADMKAIDKNLSKEQKMAKFQEIRKNTKEEINKVLTPEQQKKYGEMGAQRKEHHKKDKTDSKS